MEQSLPEVPHPAGAEAFLGASDEDAPTDAMRPVSTDPSARDEDEDDDMPGLADAVTGELLTEEQMERLDIERSTRTNLVPTEVISEEEPDAEPNDMDE